MRRYRVDLFTREFVLENSLECSTADLRYDYLTADKSTLTIPGKPYLTRGDFAVIYSDNKRIFDARVEDYDNSDDNRTTVTLLPLVSSLLDVDIYQDVTDLNNGTVTIPQFMTAAIQSLYASDDPYCNIKGLTINDNGLTTIGSVEAQSSSIYNLYDLAVHFCKMYGFIIDFSLDPTAKKLLISYREIQEYRFKHLKVACSDIIKYTWNNNNTSNRPNKITYYNSDYFNAASNLQYIRSHVRSNTDFDKDYRQSILQSFNKLNQALDFNADPLIYKAEIKAVNDESTTLTSNVSSSRKIDNKEPGITKDISVSSSDSTNKDTNKTSGSITITITETYTNLSPKKPDEVSVTTNTSEETTTSTDPNGKKTVSVNKTKNEKRVVTKTELSGEKTVTTTSTEENRTDNKTTGAWSKTVTTKTSTVKTSADGNTETSNERNETVNTSYDPTTKKTTATDEPKSVTEDVENPNKYSVEVKEENKVTEKSPDGKTTITTTDETVNSTDKTTGKVTTSKRHRVERSNAGSPKREKETTISRKKTSTYSIKTDENGNVTCTLTTSEDNEKNVEDDDRADNEKSTIKMEGTPVQNTSYVYANIIDQSTKAIKSGWYDAVLEVNTKKAYTKTVTKSVDTTIKATGAKDGSNTKETYKYSPTSNETVVTFIAPEEPEDKNVYEIYLTKTVKDKTTNKKTDSHPTFDEYLKDVTDKMLHTEISVTYYWHPSTDVIGGGTIDTDGTTNRVIPVKYKVKSKTGVVEEEDADGKVITPAKSFSEAAMDDAADEMYSDRYDDYIVIHLNSDTKLVDVRGIGELYTIIIDNFKYNTILTGIHRENEHELELTFGMMRQTLTQRLKNFIRKNL